MIKRTKAKEKNNNPMEELNTILDTLKKTFDVKAKTIKIRKVRKDEKGYGCSIQEPPTTLEK